MAQSIKLIHTPKVGRLFEMIEDERSMFSAVHVRHHIQPNPLVAYERPHSLSYITEYKMSSRNTYTDMIQPSREEGQAVQYYNIYINII